MADGEADVQQGSIEGVSPDSLLDLLLRQRLDGDVGVKLTFHKDLAQQITLAAHPFHFCGLRGKTALAAYLYSRGVRSDRPFHLASFSANGPADGSPWSKIVSVTPQETAMLAGHAETAQLLALVEAGVPLRWSRHNHRGYPNSFRKHVRQLMEALVASPGFAALPGPVRVLVVDTVISDSARTLVWGSLGSGSGAWGEPMEIHDEDSELWALAAQLSGRDTDGEEEQAAGAELPAYRFRMGLASAGRRRLIVRLIGRATAGAAAVHVARSFGCCAVVPSAGLFLAGFVAPVPALLAMSAIKLHTMRKPSPPPGLWGLFQQLHAFKDTV